MRNNYINNPIINHDAPTLQQIEKRENDLFNKLAKRELKNIKDKKKTVYIQSNTHKLFIY